MREFYKQTKKNIYISAALKILMEEGLDGFNARKIAAETGYNIASIYTYFKNLDHLENVASIYFTNDYAQRLNEITKKLNTPLETYLAMWELFAIYSFKFPNYFYNVFFSAISEQTEINLFKEYYDAYPEQLPQGSKISAMLELSQTREREIYVLKQCAEAGQIDETMLNYIANIHLMHFKCILTDIVKSKIYQASAQRYHQFLIDFCYAFLPYVCENNKVYVEKVLAFHQKNIDKDYVQFYN